MRDVNAPPNEILGGTNHSSEPRTFRGWEDAMKFRYLQYEARSTRLKDPSTHPNGPNNFRMVYPGDRRYLNGRLDVLTHLHPC